MIEKKSGKAVVLCIFYALTGGALAFADNFETSAFAFALIPGLVWLSIEDIKHYEIPDLSVLWIVLAGIVHVIYTDGQLILHAITGMAVFSLLWALGELHFRIRGYEGLGIGDAKLFGAGAVVLGPWKLPEFILISSLGGLVCIAILRLRHSNSKGLPFGPFVSYGDPPHLSGPV
ncbi:MAG: A24 family peptidase [Pseudomonadota bacterium]